LIPALTTGILPIQLLTLLQPLFASLTA
jgi:hypothetical protein